MAGKKIRKLGDPVLRERSREVEIIDRAIINLAEDMIDSVSEEDVAGVGLAAPQIGVLKRVIIAYADDKFNCFINPEIEIIDDSKTIEEEGCLSLYSIRTPIERPKIIRVRAKNLKGQEMTFEAEEMAARIFLHEVDHLNGILIIDHLKPYARKEFLSRLNKEIFL
jgi:peptide deformylase